MTENQSLKAANEDLARQHESSSKELKELRARYESKEGKYKSQRDLLARQVRGMFLALCMYSHV